MHVGSGGKGGTLAGTSNCSDIVLKHFAEKENQKNNDESFYKG